MHLRILNLQDIDRQINALSENPFELKKFIKSQQQRLDRAFQTGIEAKELIYLRSELIDHVLKALWQKHNLDRVEEICLIAVGGYGRHQLHPYSDVDILVLFKEELTPFLELGLTNFFSYLWNLGIDFGHSIRNLNDSINIATVDLDSYTNLLEQRLLIGDDIFYQQFLTTFNKSNLWPGDQFLKAKNKEQSERFKKYNHSAYLLEPDIKNSPGGLRDINMIDWLIEHYFKTSDRNVLLSHDILSYEDLQLINRYQNFLWNLRYALHLLTQRKENRLFFDQQTTLAKHFGYKSTQKKLAVEQFMKNYFIAVKEIRALNSILIQYLEEQYSPEFANAETFELSQVYYVKHAHLGFKPSVDLSKHPLLILDIFLKLSEHAEIKGLLAQSCQQIRKHLALINDEVRREAIQQHLFLNLFRHGKDIYHVLQLMSRYKILGIYLPEFEHVIGQSQYDLFHIYTVDEHTLFVIRNIQRFFINTTFPLCHKLIHAIKQPEVLYLSALFHDIGKGRQGDHSKLGGKLAENFCVEHQCDKKTTHTISWLVKYHLLMSFTAQKKDINDLNVIRKFAIKVRTLSRLKYLYLLTVADIYATNENLWNSWKDALLKQLYYKTKRYLLETPNIRASSDIILNKQKAVLETLKSVGYDEQVLEDLFEKLGNTYFIKENEDTILWHIQGIIEHGDQDEPLIMMRTIEKLGATEIFVYTKDKDNLFATTASILDKLNLNIVDARIITSAHGYSLDTYSALDANTNAAITDLHAFNKIINTLSKHHTSGAKLPTFHHRRLPARLSHFKNMTQVFFTNKIDTPFTKLTITTLDRPGLLACLGRAFVVEKIRISSAKIATLGDRVEDNFLITDQQNQPLLDRKKQIQLRKRIVEYLEM